MVLLIQEAETEQNCEIRLHILGSKVTEGTLHPQVLLKSPPVEKLQFVHNTVLKFYYKPCIQSAL